VSIFEVKGYLERQQLLLLVAFNQAIHEVGKGNTIPQMDLALHHSDCVMHVLFTHAVHQVSREHFGLMCFDCRQQLVPEFLVFNPSDGVLDCARGQHTRVFELGQTLVEPVHPAAVDRHTYHLALVAS